MRPITRFSAGLLIGGAMAGVTRPAAGGEIPYTNAVLAVHVADRTTKASTICGTSSPIDPGHPGGQLSCSAFTSYGSLCAPYLVYLVVAKVDTSGISGASFGIEYNGDPGLGVDVNSWTQCADGLPFTSNGLRGEFPASGGGLRLTWVECQQTVIGTEGIHAVLGALDVYAYSSDRLKITPNRPLDSGPELRIANCLGAEAEVDSLYNAGWAGFGYGSRGGYNPCDPVIVEPQPAPKAAGPCPVPTKPATWGRIKSRYR
jgi:hypothetical protein